MKHAAQRNASPPGSHSPSVQSDTWHPLQLMRGPFRWEEARRQVIDTVQKDSVRRTTETVPLMQAHGRICAADITADRDYPALARSLRDGFAIHSSEAPGSSPLPGKCGRAIPNHLLFRTGMLWRS